MSHLKTINLHHHNSLADCARELFKCSEDLASLLDCIKKIGRFWIFVGDIISGIGFRPFCLRLPGPQPLDGIFWPKFLLETRLESESFEPLIGFLVFLLQKFWSENNKKSLVK